VAQPQTQHIFAGSLQLVNGSRSRSATRKYRGAYCLQTFWNALYRHSDCFFCTL